MEKTIMQNERHNALFELKALENTGFFKGYASVFNVEDGQRDVIKKGAFSENLKAWQAKGDLPKLLWQHSASAPIGVLTMLKEDNYGLYVEGQLLLDVTQAREVYALMKAGALDSMSIGYQVEQAHSEGSPKKRIITKIALWEVSIVTFPANEKAKITAVKAANITAPRDFEQFLREAGFSRRDAVSITNHGFKAMPMQREAADLVRLADTIRELI
jgi:HK97 family phage prohead protease